MRSNFVKTFPKLLGWNAHEWYKFHLTLEARACEYFLWVMPYHLQYPECPDPRGFVIGDTETEIEADLHLDYVEMIYSWQSQIADGLAQDGILPTNEAKLLLQQ